MEGLAKAITRSLKHKKSQDGSSVPMQGDDRPALDHFTNLAREISGAESVILYRMVDADMVPCDGYAPLCEVHLSEALCRQVLQEGAPLEIRDLSEDPRFSDCASVCNPEGLRYFLGMPLVSGEGETEGALCLLNRTPLDIDARTLRLLQMVAKGASRQMRQAGENRRLRGQIRQAKETFRKVIHDIRNPAAGIITGIHLIEEEGNGKDARKLFPIIRKSAQDLLTYVEEQLDKATGDDS